MKPKAVIFDIDGTLCDDEHRQHFISIEDKTKRDWHSYHSDCVHDKPFEIVCKLMYRLSHDHVIFLMTGRDEKYRKETEDYFLKQNLCCYDYLFMRPNGYNVSSVDLKRGIYRKFIKTEFDVIGVFEDRISVVKMWREEGLICLQTKEGNY